MSDIKEQDGYFVEAPYEADDGSERSDLEEIIQQEGTAPGKFTLNKKNIIILAIGILIVLLIIALCFVLKPRLIPEKIVEEMPTDEPWGDFEEELPLPFAYSIEEADMLRAVGYTAREIEDFEIQEIIDIQPLLDKQIKARQETFLDIYRAFLREAKESGNEQYNYVLSNSYLGLPPQEFIQEDVKTDYVTYTENVDYWKMPLQGWQPMVKLRLINDAVIFMTVTPSRYEELRESGNMNIRYDYIYFKGVKCVINVTEIVN